MLISLRPKIVTSVLESRFYGILYGKNGFKMQVIDAALYSQCWKYIGQNLSAGVTLEY